MLAQIEKRGTRDEGRGTRKAKQWSKHLQITIFCLSEFIEQLNLQGFDYDNLWARLIDNVLDFAMRLLWDTD
jgi:hypothetical protein